jgi:hypothetical protein
MKERAMVDRSFGLPKFEAKLRELLPELTISPVTVMGKVDSAGDTKPLLASAARLSVGTDSWHVPWPLPEPPDEASGIRKRFLWSGIFYVFPTIRLCATQVLPRTTTWEFLTLDDWLTDALMRWVFPPAKTVNLPVFENLHDALRYYKDLKPTIFQQLRKRKGKPLDQLRAVGNLIRFALRGSRGDNLQNMLSKTTGLGMPKRGDDWLRSLESLMKGDDDGSARFADSSRSQVDYELDFRTRCLRSLVITAYALRCDELFFRLGRLEKKKEKRKQKRLRRFIRSEGFPWICRVEGLQLNATDCQQVCGIDPFHTSEGEPCRFQLHLGDGVEITPQQSLDAKLGEVALSPSTARLPVAGFNDPRRLLLASKAQVQAVALKEREPPRIVTAREGPDPDGVNLRVGYLAWAGWNHEDAWVISDSAARKLTCVEKWAQTVAVSHFEEPYNWRDYLAKPSTRERGEPLITRRIDRAMLWLNWAEITRGKRRFETSAFELEEQPEDCCKHDGSVNCIEIWEKADDGWRRIRGSSKSAPVVAPEHFAAKYRQIIRFFLERELPLEVGDKLANRHGHKGVVGLILPDDRMPRWNGEPLEALIDPISVMNRANWGQLYESLAGAVAAYEEREKAEVAERTAKEWQARFREVFTPGDFDCVKIDPPEEGWLASRPDSKPIHAIAGVQFIMRMPQHATDKVAVRRTNRRGMKVSVQSHFALWAHGRSGKAAKAQLSEGAAELERVLRLAGIELKLTDARGGWATNGEATHLTVCHFRLDKDPPRNWHVFKPEAQGQHRSVKEQLAELGPDHYVEFDPPLELSRNGYPWKLVRWLPVVPYEDWNPREPERTPRYFEALAELVLAEQSRNNPKRTHDAFRKLVWEALRHATGTSSKNAKRSLLRNQVQAFRRAYSGRAVITPSGLPSEDIHRQASDSDFEGLFYVRSPESPLGIDEIGLPLRIYSVLRKSVTGSEANSDDPSVPTWITRHPVLHRWGFLPVHARAIEGIKAIRLPASLLDPLGGDFDGDEADVLAISDDHADIFSRLSPSAICRHDFHETNLFKPSKQYIYGLYLLEKDVALLREFQDELQSNGAPSWPDGQKNSDSDSHVTSLDRWLNEVAVSEKRNGKWWAVLEKYALLALAADPGMGLLVPTKREDLLNLPVVQCGAAKGAIYGQDAVPIADGRGSIQIRMVGAVLRGDSLTLHQDGIDPIGSIMAKAHSLKEKFGGQIKHFVFRARTLNSKIAMAAQTLTEVLTQKALSVKTLDADLPDFNEFNYQKDRWRKVNRGIDATIEGVPETALKKLDEAFFSDNDPSALLPKWGEWLDQPEKLPKLLADEKELRLPLDDLRVQPFVSRILSDRS